MVMHEENSYYTARTTYMSVRQAYKMSAQYSFQYKMLLYQK